MNAAVGILGGMGPLATVDFMQKIIYQTPAKRDQDHLPLFVYSVPQIPDRTACLIDDEPSPLAALELGVNTLVSAGVGCIAIPCNTAHYWYDALAQASRVPIIHIAKACSESLARQGVTSVGLLATNGTLKAGFYPRELNAYGIDLKLPKPLLQKKVMEGIFLVKSGAVEEGGRLLEQCMDEMLQYGVEKIILGCTEIPFSLDQINSTRRVAGMDATKALAEACLNWYIEQDNAV